MQRNILSWYMDAPLLWGALVHFTVLATLKVEYCQPDTLGLHKVNEWRILILSYFPSAGVWITLSSSQFRTEQL